jgi:hypothetical protein
MQIRMGLRAWPILGCAFLMLLMMLSGHAQAAPNGKLRICKQHGSRWKHEGQRNTSNNSRWLLSMQ